MNIKDILINTYETDKFIEKNEGLIYKVYKKTFPSIFNSQELEDYIQEGRMSLYKAMLKYDDTKEIQFSTFAYVYIKKNLLRKLRDNKNKISMFEKNAYSLNSKINDNDELEWLDILPSTDNFVDDIIENITKEELLHNLQNVENKLNNTDKQVFFLLINTKNHIQIANKLGVSRQCIGQRVKRIRNIIRELQIA